MQDSKIEKMASARVPIEEGEFLLTIYRNGDGKDHLAYTLGDLKGKEGVLSRIHSECFTGDVLGSKRCDCGPQLKAALALIGEAGCGVVIYLRQEGRGIGLLNKLRAYNLQDIGYDTVDANLELGHQADERNYTVAAQIFQDLGVGSVDLITNNPSKIEGLRDLGVSVRSRVPLVVGMTPENQSYIETKIARMNHLITPTQPISARETDMGALHRWLQTQPIPNDRPLVTLAFAQSLDGSIGLEPNQQLLLSGPQSQLLTHRLRCWHDGILIGIGTVLADDPRLTVRLVTGVSPQPIVLDSTLRLPLTAQLLNNAQKPWIATSPGSSTQRRDELRSRGARLIEVATAEARGLDLGAVLKALRQNGIQRLMVEGGATILSAFMRAQLADMAVVTVAPRMVGGLPVLCQHSGKGDCFPNLREAVWTKVGEDMVVWGRLEWNTCKLAEKAS